MWIEYNPNPCGRRVGDCTVRAISKALNTDWETAYAMIVNAAEGPELAMELKELMQDAPEESKQDFKRLIQKIEQM